MSARFPVFSWLTTEYRYWDALAIPALIAGILTATCFPITGVGIVCLIIALVLGVIPRLRNIRPIAGLLFFFACGLLSMSYRSGVTTTSFLEKPLYDLVLTGRVDEASLLPDGQRITLSNIRFLNEPFSQTPERIQLKYKGDNSLFLPDTFIQATVSLRPTHSALLAGDYDERTLLAFEKIGAVGTIKSIEEIRQPPTTPRTRLEDLRTAIRTHLQSHLSAEEAQLAIPLVLGDQGVISPEIYRLFRSAGIAHILSVSGLHLSLLTLFIFLLMRKIFSFFPQLSERLAGKKIAMVCAFVGACFYVALSGMRIPALRALIMVGVVTVGVLFERKALSVRSLNIAAFLLLIFCPEFVFNIGFQLSFLAVLILVSLYPKLSTFLFPNKLASFFNRCGRWIAGFILVNLLITLATAPVVAQHFNQLPLYGLLGNALTNTLFAFWILPLLFMSLPLMIFGCEHLFLVGAGIGLDCLIAFSRRIDALPHALISVPSFSITAFLLMTGGIIMICLMRTPIRLMGTAILITGIICADLTPRPDLLIGDKGQTIAVRETGHLRFPAVAPSESTARYWLLKNGENPKEIPTLPFQDSFIIKGKHIAFTAKACVRADVCFLSDPNPRQPNALPRYRATPYAVYVHSDRIEVKNP